MPLAAETYRPRAPRKTPLYELVLDHHERFQAVYEERYATRYGPWRPHVHGTLLRYLDCGDFSSGFLRVACSSPGCRHEVLVPFSCKRGICPSCAMRRSLDFAEFLDQEVLEQVPYRHVVATVPRVLRRIFLRDRALLRELGHCVWKTVCRGLRVALGDSRTVPGAVMVRATAGDLVNFHRRS